MLAALDIDLVGRQTARTLKQIKQTTADLRLDVRDWEYADSQAELKSKAAAVRKRSHELQALILKASEHGIFSAIDVVDLSAQLDAIQQQLL